MNTFRIPLLSRIAGLRHVFTGRGAEPRPDPAGLLPLLADGPDGLDGPLPLATLRQVHSSRCLLVEEPAPGVSLAMGAGDALATSAPRVALGVATADCLALVAVDPEGRALAVAHAGWRGTLDGVLESALDTMRARLGARPERIVVGAGPSAGVCCYRVGPEVAEAFARRRSAHAGRVIVERAAGVTHLDLLEANRLQALDAGVDPSRFVSVGICTLCRPDITHSYRRDGRQAGRMWALAALV